MTTTPRTDAVCEGMEFKADDVAKAAKIRDHAKTLEMELSITLKVLKFLASNPPIQSRRAWWNIARGIGHPKNESVIPILNELLKYGLIRRQASGKGHPWSFVHQTSVHR